MTKHSSKKLRNSLSIYFVSTVKMMAICRLDPMGRKMKISGNEKGKDKKRKKRSE